MNRRLIPSLRLLGAGLCTALLLPLGTVAAEAVPQVVAPAAKTAATSAPMREATAKDADQKQSAPAAVPATTAPGPGPTPAASARGAATISTGSASAGKGSSQDAVSAAQGKVGADRAGVSGSVPSSSDGKSPGFNQGFTSTGGVNVQGAAPGGNPMAGAQPGKSGISGSTGAAGSGMVSQCTAGTTTSATGACTNADGEVSSKGKASDAGNAVVNRSSNVNTQEDGERPHYKSTDGRNEAWYDFSGNRHVIVNGQEVGTISPTGAVTPTASGCPPDLEGCTTQDKLTWLKNLSANINYQVKLQAAAGSTVNPNPNDSGFAVGAGAALPSATQTKLNMVGNPGEASAPRVVSAGGGSSFGASNGAGAINPGPDGNLQTGSSRSDDPGQFFNQQPPAPGQPAPGCDADGRTADTRDDCKRP